MEPIDPRALTVLETLEQAGYQAVLVGGCVRDLLLGRRVHDYDMATAASPEAVQALFARTVPTGIRHGTVTVLLEGASFEVTTFRADGDYPDHRRPENVRYVSDLQQDLLRRDFTVNAMAMDRRGVLTDCVGGQEDLRRGLIRCVGEPERRFEEDALRMLRAVRFSAQLGFRVEDATRAAIAACAPLCVHLSAERVRDELEKTLCSPRPQALGELIDLGLLHAQGLDDHPDLSPLDAVPPDRLARWAMAKKLLPGLDLAALRLEKRAVRLCTDAAAICDSLDGTLACKRAVADFGWDAAELAGVLAHHTQTLAAIRASGDCVTLSQLALRGDELPGVSGEAVSPALRRLLFHVLEHPEDNEKTRLLALLEES